MIIEFPTALYDSVLPQEQTDSQNVTYLISSEDPPRATESLQQLPIVEALRPLPTRVFTQAENRARVGEFIFSVSQSTQSDIESNKKQFEIGQLIDFEPQEDIETLTNTQVPIKIDLQQNTNLINLEEIGLTEDEASAITVEAVATFDLTLSQLNSTMELITNNRASIRENQKDINEVRKAISAIEVISDMSDISDILEKLKVQEQDLIEERTRLIEETNILNEQALSEYNDLLSIRELVR